MIMVSRVSEMTMVPKVSAMMMLPRVSAMIDGVCASGAKGPHTSGAELLDLVVEDRQQDLHLDTPTVAASRTSSVGGLKKTSTSTVKTPGMNQAMQRRW